MKTLRILARILLSPLTLLLTVFVRISILIVERCAGILNILSAVVFLGALVSYAQYLFGWPVGTAGETATLQLAIFAIVSSFLLSPYGIPALAAWLLSKIEDLNKKIKAI